MVSCPARSSKPLNSSFASSARDAPSLSRGLIFNRQSAIGARSAPKHKGSLGYRQHSLATFARVARLHPIDACILPMTDRTVVFNDGNRPSRAHPGYSQLTMSSEPRTRLHVSEKPSRSGDQETSRG